MLRHYNHSSKLSSTTFLHEFETNEWFHVIIQVCLHTGMASLYVDCNKIYEKPVNWACAPAESEPQSTKVCIGKMAQEEYGEDNYPGLSVRTTHGLLFFSLMNQIMHRPDNSN